MSYHLTSPPSSLYSASRNKPFHHISFSSSSSSISISTLPLHRLQTLTQISKPKVIKNVSLQDTPVPQDSKKQSSKKSYIWVNPKSAKASQLRQHSYDARYVSLSKLSEALDTCPPEKVASLLDNESGTTKLEQDAVIVLNNMTNPENAVLALTHFRQRLEKISREVIMYNVTFKVLRKRRDFLGSETLFDEMLKRGVQPDNVTFSTIISCARLCSLADKAVELFEKMPQFECEPDDVTYSAMIDVYGRAGNVEKALSLYDRARTEKWRIDPVTFATLIRIYGTSGNFDGCLNVYEEMKALGVKPNLVVFNTLFDAMGRARRPWQAKAIYKDMVSKGISPTFATYAALLRAYGRSRYSEDALRVYYEMKEKEMQLNVVLYNTILAMCADVGLAEEAAKIFQDLKTSGHCKPDSWTYSSMLTINSCSGNVSDAEQMLNEMLEAGFEPNIFVLTSLIQCYGKANRTDDVVRTYNRLVELGISPDERLCGCLLNVMTQTPKEELGKLAECVEKANPKLGRVVKLIVGEEEGEFKREASELFDSLGPEVKKAYCNCLIDLCVNLNLLEKACELLDLGLTLEIYTGMQSRSPTQWSLHLKSLSLGAALTALHVWMNDLSKSLDNWDEIPALLGINTGHGRHRYSEKGLAGVFEAHLKELNAPFHESPDREGWFLTTKAAAKTWLESRNLSELADA